MLAPSHTPRVKLRETQNLGANDNAFLNNNNNHNNNNNDVIITIIIIIITKRSWMRALESAIDKVKLGYLHHPFGWDLLGTLQKCEMLVYRAALFDVIRREGAKSDCLVK